MKLALHQIGIVVFSFPFKTAATEEWDTSDYSIYSMSFSSSFFFC